MLVDDFGDAVWTVDCDGTEVKERPFDDIVVGRMRCFGPLRFGTFRNPISEDGFWFISWVGTTLCINGSW